MIDFPYESARDNVSNAGRANKDAAFAVALTSGLALAPVVHLAQPLSFWGGFDPQSGCVVEPTHKACGVRLAGKVLVMSHAKGSSSSSSVLAEAIRHGSAPAAIVLRERDLIIAIGAIAAHELYGIALPVVVASPALFEKIAHAPGDVRINAVTATGYAHDTQLIGQHGRVDIQFADAAS